jgi:hypothetical protein
VLSIGVRWWAHQEWLQSISILHLTTSPAGAPRMSSPVCKHPDSHNRVDVDATPAQHHDFLLDFISIAREIETF